MIFLRIGANSVPGIVERIYSRGLFVGVRWMFDILFTWIPLPWVCLVVPAIILYWIFAIRSWWQQPAGKNKWALMLLGPAAWISGGMGLFLLLWGFNYQRIPIEKQLGLEPVPLDSAQLAAELDTVTAWLVQARLAIPNIQQTDAGEPFLPTDFMSKVRFAEQQWLLQNGFPAPGKVHVKPIWPKGLFLRFSSSGLYFPFTGEGYVDMGVHPLQRPFTLAHEMAHAHGFGDEGTCNFVGLMACLSSEDPYIRYSGLMGYWRYIAIGYRRMAPETYLAFREQLPAGIIADLEAISAYLDRYPDIMPHFRYITYDTYLKVQGISEGMLNYNRILVLGRAWRKKNNVLMR